MMILISLILGLAYIWAMKRMSQYDSCEKEKEKHWWLKAVAAILTLFISLVGADELLKAEGRTLGHTTGILSACLLLFGVVVYLINFKRSDSRWWSKLLKFVWGLFFFGIGFVTAGEVAAEDYRLMAVPAIIFVVMFIIITIVTSRDKSEAEEDEEEESHVNMDDVENFRFNEKEISESSQGCGDGKKNGRTGKKRESTIDTIGKYVAYIVGVVVIFLLVLCTVVESFSSVSSMESQNLEEDATNAYQNQTNSDVLSDEEFKKMQARNMLKDMMEHVPSRQVSAFMYNTNAEYLPEKKCTRFNYKIVNLDTQTESLLENVYNENASLVKELMLCKYAMMNSKGFDEFLKPYEEAGFSIHHCVNFTSGNSFEVVITPQECRELFKTMTKRDASKKLLQWYCKVFNLQTPIYIDEEAGIAPFDESQINKMKKKYEIFYGYSMKGSDFILEYSEPESVSYLSEELGSEEYSTEDLEKMLVVLCEDDVVLKALMSDIGLGNFDLVFKFTGVKSGKIYTLRFPNEMVRKHSFLWKSGNAVR